MVEKTRNGGIWTEARYFAAIRSSLRRGFRFWKPSSDAKAKARRPYGGSNRRQKWEYQCAECCEWFKDKDIQIDHIIPVGTLKTLEDLPEFVGRLTPEGGFQVLCKPCHQQKTNRERNVDTN